LTPKLQLLARYDIFEPNQLIKRNDNTEYTIGANYFFVPNVKLQLNAVHVTSDALHDSNRVMALSQYVF
jgi:phosphate-selective porin